jgi:putative ABC transport system permease protein
VKLSLLLSYNLRSVLQRWRTSLLAVFGIGLVVGVLGWLFAMSSGLRETLRSTGIPENAIVVQKGSNSELTSGIGNDAASLIEVDARVARGPDGRPLASPEMVVVASLKRRSDGAPINVLVRGVTPRAFAVRHGIEIALGRNFTPGLGEIVVGRRLLDQFEGIDIGDTITLQRRPWTVVGVFGADGSGFESEIWGDADLMRQAFNRTGGWQSLTLRLKDPASLAAFADALAKDPRFQVEMKQEQAYYEAQAGGTGTALLYLGYFVTVILGVGAAFGVINTMYGIVGSRTREIGTLRALGFSRGTILVGVLVESILLALIGGVLGVLFTFPFEGYTAATAGASFNQLSFAFRITPRGIAAGMIVALVLGVIGGLLPAIRAARIPVTAALREA